MSAQHIFLALWLSCALAALGCSREHENESEQAQLVARSLRLKWVFDPGFAGEMVATKAGLFESHGLSLQLNPGGFEADPIKLVAAGSDDFGVAGADSFLLAREKGVPIVAIAAGYLQTPVGYYVRQASSISGPRDFAGKRVGYQAGQDTATVYEVLLRRAHIDRSAVVEVPVKFDFSLFLRGEIDVWPGYVATQSWTLSKENVPYRTLLPSEFGVSYLGTVYFVNSNFLADHRDEVQAFVNGLIEGWEYTYKNVNEAVRLVREFDSANLSEAYIRFALEKQKTQIRPEGSRFCEFSADQWRELASSLEAVGLLGNKRAIEGAYTFDFLAQHYGK